MTMLTSFPAFLLLLLLCFSSFLSSGFSRPVSLPPASASSNAAIVDEASSHQTPIMQEDWFYAGWPFAYHPPAGGYKWPDWPFVQSPMPGGSFKWPYKQWPHKQWPFVHPPMPAVVSVKWPPKQWPFVPPPIPEGGAWPFLKPPFPCPWWPHKASEERGAREDDEAAPPPLTA